MARRRPATVTGSGAAGPDSSWWASRSASTGASIARARHSARGADTPAVLARSLTSEPTERAVEPAQALEPDRDRGVEHGGVAVGEHRHRAQHPARRAVLLPARAGVGAELATQRTLRHAERGAHRALG